VYRPGTTGVTIARELGQSEAPVVMGGWSGAFPGVWLPLTSSIVRPRRYIPRAPTTHRRSHFSQGSRRPECLFGELWPLSTEGM
jgi:hypothetical protein